MSKWYVIKVTPGKERQLNEQFNTQISTGKIGFINRFICPTEKEMRLISGKKTYREKVLYSGYLYFETPEALTNEQSSLVSSNPSVMSMLGDKQPRRMSPDDISRIIKDDVLDKHKEDRSLKYLIGENITIVSGPFATFNGVIESVKNDKVQLNVKVFGRSTTVEVGLDQIEKS
jgi:transcriptional antiterminator NusG